MVQPGSFKALDQFTFGNSGRAILFGPGQWIIGRIRATSVAARAVQFAPTVTF